MPTTNEDRETSIYDRGDNIKECFVVNCSHDRTPLVLL